MRESTFQARIIRRLRKDFPGAIVLKNDSSYLQGIPDLLVLFEDKWALLEVKASATAAHEPNQEYYVGLAQTMSFGAFIYPENEEEVFSALQHTLNGRGAPRVP